MLLFSLKRDLRPVAYQTGRIRSSISYRTRASFHMVRAKLQSYDRYPLVARAFFFRIRNERLLEIRGPTSRSSALKNSGRLRKISDKRFYACHQRVRLLFSLTETSTSHPRDSATHSPYLPYPPTARGKKRGDSFGRKQSRPTSSRFVSTFHVTQRRPMYESWDHPTRSRTFRWTERRTERRTKIKRIGRNRGRGVQGAREEGTTLNRDRANTGESRI